MSAIDQIGTFRGMIKDCGVSETSKGKYPQFVVTLLATEAYDEANEEWLDWSEFEQTITGYFVLTTLDASGMPVKCLNYQQVMEAVGWDGETYSSLATMELKGKVVQFRVQENEYEGIKRLQVNWIADENADVGLRKLIGKDLTALDAKFGVASNKKTATAAAPKDKTKTKAKVKPPKIGKKKEEEKEESVEPCTEEDAYQACLTANKNSKKPAPSEILDDYWVNRVNELAADTDNITGEEWAKIRNAVLKDVDIPF